MMEDNLEFGKDSSMETTTGSGMNPHGESNYELIGEDKHRSPIYFVPDIDDIRVGYQCEIWWNYNYLPENEWCSVLVLKGSTEDFDMYDFTSRIKKKEIRVPYLTKEQIEKEGWEYGESGHGCRFYFKKPHPSGNGFTILNARGWIGYSARHLEVYTEFIPHNMNTIYSGECKDINTFRYICKLLSI